MRIALATAAFATLCAPIAAEAQTVRRSGTMMQSGMMQSGMRQMAPMTQTARLPNSGGRWGGMVGGRWYGGVHAPGGWQAYRRPARGWVLPTYWTAPSFVIYDWSNYGLNTPPQGYNWYRYYDDAVLADARGRVYDSRSDLSWDGGYDVDDRVYAEQSSYDYYDSADHAGASYAPPPPGPAPRRDTGVGGALIGGAVGGVAGNLIAGRGNRLGGTLIGAGVGALAGLAIDSAEDRGRGRNIRDDRRYRDDRGRNDRAYREYRDDRGYGYDSRGYADRGYSVHGGYDGPPPAVINTPGGGTIVTQSSGGYWGGMTTTVVVQPAVTTTTTTTEYVYETVAAAPRRRVVHRKRAVAKPRTCSCVCRTVCR